MKKAFVPTPLDRERDERDRDARDRNSGSTARESYRISARLETYSNAPTVE